MTNLNIYERAQIAGRFIVDKKATIRQAASALKVSKSTLHKDVTTILRENHDPLADEVKEVLDNNFLERHLRGGEATKQKYLKMKYTK